MPIDSKGYLTTPSDTSTEAVGVVGEIREHIDATYGKQLYRMVKNTSGADIAANLAVVFISGSSEAVALSGAAAPAATVAGITQNIIPNGEWGWVCCGGDCKATSAAAMTANSLVSTIGAAGLVDDTAVSTIEHCVIGVAPSAFGSATTGTIRLRNLT